ncbi:MAG: FAD:protein FMN transferase [Acutalibacteraceae bacterium]
MQDNKYQIQKMFFALGTVNTLTVFDKDSKQALQKAKKRVSELNNMFSVFASQSEVSVINNYAGKKSVKVSGETFHLIEKSVEYSILTDGYFDITISPVSMLWKKALKTKTIPSESQIQRAAGYINYRDILTDSCSNSVMLKKQGQQIDLGAIAKGYAADEIRRIFTENNIFDAVINLGGTVINMGQSRKVGIQNPFLKTGTPFAYITVQDKAVVSSGLYEQSFTKDGKIYHHIISPKTAYPSDSELMGVTLVGDNAEKLDALSTAVFIMGTEKALNLINKLNIDAVFITKEKKVFATNGLKSNLKIIS